VNSVLVVDDEAAMRHLMMRWVELAGHRASTASSANEALDIMAQERPAIALCDLRMPGHDGLWLAERIRRNFPDTAVIMATAARDTDPRVAEHTGAVDYLLKPFGRDRLKFALERAFDWHHSASTRREWVGRLTGEMVDRRSGLLELIAATAADAQPLAALLTVIGNHDPRLLAHSRRVAAMSVRIGEALALDSHALDVLRTAALLHDIGKLALPEAILLKPAALSLEEKEVVRQHPDIAVELLKTCAGCDESVAIVHAANERYDGSGYPLALDGELIPLASRILAVADAYDAMTHTQIYRDAMPSSEAAKEILRCSSTQFDPIVTATLLEILSNRENRTH
jgi:putative nucleotidyltransferase with HDIG domain